MEGEKLFCCYDENADLISTLEILQENLVSAIREIARKRSVDYSDVEAYCKAKYIIEGLLKDIIPEQKLERQYNVINGY